MVEESFVSFETAKMLKEKGFDELGDYYYTKNGEFTDCLTIGYVNCGDRVICKNHTLFPYKAPTQQMAMRWLREVHNISVEIASGYTLSRDGAPLNWYWSARVIKLKTLDKPILVCRRDTFEEACEAAIKYALENLI